MARSSADLLTPCASPRARREVVRAGYRANLAVWTSVYPAELTTDSQTCTRLGTMSQDPIGFNAGDANLYRYVGNGPTSYVDPSGLNRVKVIYKIGEQIVKVTRLSVDEVRSILRARTKDAAKPKAQRKYSEDAKVFVSTTDDKTAKDLAEKASPTGEAVYHPPTNGYPGHYHPVKKRNSKGKPETEGTPHIGSDYQGYASVAIALGILEQGGEIMIDLTPVGDVRDIITGVPEIVGGTCGAIEITTAERVRDWQLRTQAGVLGQDQISTMRSGEVERKPLRAGSWRDPNPLRW
jgi:hypothetical protein